MTQTMAADEPEVFDAETLQLEVLDAETLQLVAQLGASLSQRAVALAEENRALRATVETLQAGWKPLSQRENERLRGELDEVRTNRDYLRRMVNDRNHLITGLRAQIAILSRRNEERSAELAAATELIGRAWGALGEAGIGQGPDLTLSDAIRALADTPLDALPKPDPSNPKHANFVGDWVGEFTDEQLGFGVDPDPEAIEATGDIVREQILGLVDRIATADQLRGSRIDAAAKVMSESADRGCMSLSWESLTEEMRDQWRNHARALDNADLLA